MKNNLKKLVLIILAAFAAAAAGGSAGAQSLWRDDGPYSNFIRNNTARRVGDLLTVVIAETASIQNSEETKTDRSGSLSAKLTSFDIAPKAFGTLPAFSAEHKQQFDGKGDQTRQNSFTTRIQVQVHDLLPNGNLLVLGRRTITVDDETKTIEIRGVVRAQDVAADNTVKSEQVANAEISYIGEGALTRTTTKGVVAKVFDIIFHVLWPF
ncbi:MAG: flagellar basal body L-ring protein FlgH [Planctomycetes bacterium]|nr:flagellar basal body L-ring protein FlgH [Planctomycetota bacterium]